MTMIRHLLAVPIATLVATTQSLAQEAISASGAVPSTLESSEVSEHGALRFVAHEALLLATGMTDDRELVHWLAAHDCRVLGRIPAIGALRIGLPQDHDDDDSLGSITRLHGVEAAEWNGIISAAGAVPPPNDTYFGVQWHLSNTGQGQGWKSGADIQVLDAWSIERGSPETVVAVVDSGVRLTHPELEGRLLQGYDFVQNDAVPDDPFGHGTKVAGLIAANVNNGLGMAGINWQCKILPVRVLDSSGEGTVFNLAAAIVWAAENGADIINLSISYPVKSAVVEQALKAARGMGVIIIAAAGNLPGAATADQTWPGASPYTIAVGGTLYDDTHDVGSSSGTAVDFSAPSFVFTISNQAGVDWDALGGTSASAAIASGIASLLLAVTPKLSQDEVYSVMQLGAEDQVGLPSEDTGGWDPMHGYGRLNAYRSLVALCGCTDLSVLSVSPPSLALDVGGSWRLRVNGTRELAGGSYMLLGSTTGTSPGLTLGLTQWPLIADDYLRITMSGSPWLRAFVGVLDEEGKAVAQITVPEGLPPVLGGLELHHAAAIWADSPARMLAVSAAVVSNPQSVFLRLPPQTLWLEDFESGIVGWSTSSTGEAEWHLVGDSVCGSRSQMAAFNEPGSCSFAIGSETSAVLMSPTFSLNGIPPFTIEFDMIRDVLPEASASTRVSIVDDSAVSPMTTQVIGNYELTNSEWGTGLVHVRFQLPQSHKLKGRPIHLEFVGTVSDKATGSGWLVDNIVIRDYGAQPKPASK
jgi:subtilisin family serine protease